MSDDEQGDDATQGQADDAPAAQPTVDAASARTHRSRRKEIELEREQARLFWSRTLRDPVGAREIFLLLRAGGLLEDRFACGPNGFPQPEATWASAGEQRFVWRWYLKLSQFDREAVLLMHEAHDPNFAPSKPARRRVNDAAR